jgi:outer membrane immunogenic protein
LCSEIASFFNSGPRMKKRCALAMIVAGLIVSSPTFAADLSPAPPVFYKAPVAAPAPSWTGFYVGGSVGIGWGSEDPVDINQYAGAEGAADPVGDAWRYGMGTGFIGGGTIGYDHQFGMFVAGLEGDFGYLRQTGSGADPRSPGLDVVSSAVLGDWYAIIAGRAGIVYDRALFYGKVGAGWTPMSATITDTCSTAPCGPLTILANGRSPDDATLVLGGGIEYLLNQNWSVKVEYLDWSLGTHFLVTGVASNGNTYSWDHSFSPLQTVMFGVNYRFN